MYVWFVYVCMYGSCMFGSCMFVCMARLCLYVWLVYVFMFGSAMFVCMARVCWFSRLVIAVETLVLVFFSLLMVEYHETEQNIKYRRFKIYNFIFNADKLKNNHFSILQHYICSANFKELTNFYFMSNK